MVFDKTRIENKANFLLKDVPKTYRSQIFWVAKTVTKPNVHLGRQIHITAISLDKAAVLKVEQDRDFVCIKIIAPPENAVTKHPPKMTDCCIKK